MPDRYKPFTSIAGYYASKTSMAEDVFPFYAAIPIVLIAKSNIFINDAFDTMVADGYLFSVSATHSIALCGSIKGVFSVYYP